MIVVTTFFHWLVVPVGKLVAGLAVLWLGILPLFAGGAVWFFTVNFLDETRDGSPRRIRTGLIAGLLAFYVLLVTGDAIYIELPHAILQATGQG